MSDIICKCPNMGCGWTGSRAMIFNHMKIHFPGNLSSAAIEERLRRIGIEIEDISMEEKDVDHLPSTHR